MAEMLVDAKEEAKEEERLKEGKEEENAGEEGGFTGFAGLYDELSRGVQEEAAVEDVVGLLASPGGPAGTSFAAPAPPASVAAAPAVAAAQDMGPLTSFMVSVDATGGEGGAGSGGGGGLAAGGMGGQDGHRSQVFAGGEHGGNERPKLSLKERMQLLGMRKKE